MHLRWHCPLLRLRRRTLNQQQHDDDDDDDDNEGHGDVDRHKHKDEDPANKEHWLTYDTKSIFLSSSTSTKKEHQTYFL